MAILHVLQSYVISWQFCTNFTELCNSLAISENLIFISHVTMSCHLYMQSHVFEQASYCLHLEFQLPLVCLIISDVCLYICLFVACIHLVCICSFTLQLHMLSHFQNSNDHAVVNNFSANQSIKCSLLLING